MVEQNRRLLWRICLSRLKDEHSANDAVQEAFLSAWHHIQTKGWPETPLQPWLARIAVHKCIDELRRRSRRGSSLEDCVSAGHAEPSALQPSIEDSVEGAQALAELNLALDCLSADLRTSLLLHTLDGKRYGEIARLTQVPVGTVKSRIHRARSIVRSHLGTASLVPGDPAG